MHYEWFADHHPADGISPWQLDWNNPVSFNINSPEQPWTVVDPWLLNDPPTQDQGRHRWALFKEKNTSGIPIVAIPVHRGWNRANIHVIIQYLHDPSRRWILSESKLQIIIQYSSEGFGDEVYQSMHDLAAGLGIKPYQLLYVSGSINNKALYDNWADYRQLPITERIRVCYDLFWLRCASNQTRSYPTLNQVSVKSYAPLPESPRILCLNRRLHPHRVFLAVELAKRNLIGQLRYSLPNTIQESNKPKINLLDIWNTYKSFFIDDFQEEEYSNAVDLLQQHLPLSADGADPNVNHCQDLNPDLSIEPINIITETHFFNSLHFPSEKIFKPMIYGQIFIPVAASGYSDSLRKIGFRTFDALNNQFDYLNDHRDRLLKISDLIQWLSMMPQTEFNGLIKTYINDAVHNQRILFNRQTSRYISIANMKKEIELYVGLP
jgi:hypothetical protein